MKKQGTRLLSLLLSFAMVLGMLPAVTPHVHAAGTGEIVLIGPDGIAIAATVPPSDSGFTNEDLLAFYLNAGGTYTLTTNGTSANAVSLLVNTTDDITVVLDNVSFDVVQPKRSSSYYEMLNGWTHKYNPSALEIVQADSSLSVNVEVKIKGVNNLKVAAETTPSGYEPAVLQLTGVNAVISGYDNGDNVLNIRNGTVEGKTFSPNGIVATKDLTLGSGVTYNIGDFSNKGANLFIGNEGVSCSKNLVIADGAVVNIGIDNPNGQRANCLVGKKTIGAATVNLRATYGDAIRGDTVIGDGAVVTAISDENSAVATAKELVIGNGATVSLTSNSDNYGAVLLDSPGSFSVGENSTVTITSKASGKNDWAVATDGYGYNVDVSVGSGSEVTINSGYGGLYSNNLTLGENAKLIVHADKYFGINETKSIVVGAGATLHVSSVESYGIYASNSTGKIYLNSGNVLVRGKESAFYINSSNKDFFVRSITSDEEITTYHSSDDKTWEEQGSVSWTAFTEGQTAARWFKTEAGSHVHVYTNGYEYEADKHHYGLCACGEKSPEAEACTYPDGHYNYYPRPTATKDGTRTWECSVCKGYWEETIPAHNCADYVNEWEDYGSEHKGVCTYLVEASGNTCGNTVYVEHTFTEWSDGSLTISRTCTGCGRKETKNVHENVTHMEAIPGNCSQPGRIEFWHCTDSDCGLYFSDALMKQVVKPEDTFTTPGAHSYGENGVCTVCGDKKTTVTFIEYDEHYYSSDMDGELFILVGFSDGKAYVMGNETNADGSRNAVEIPVKANGAIDADSATAEIFAFDFDEATFSPDGGYMSMMNGKIVVYDKARVDEDGLPKPMIYSRDGEYYDVTGYLLNYTNDWCIVFDAETPSFKVTDTPADTIVRYKQVCPHENLYHSPEAEATCTEQGAVEYWYCGDCDGYFMNHDFEKAVEIDNETELTKKATGHKFDSDGICENCGMKRHVYTQVSTLAEFDALSKDASYIIVFKDGDKTYAAYYPDVNAINHPNTVEVTVADDGSITVTDEGAMEFQMMEAGVRGNQEYREDDFEYYEIKDTERMRAAWIPNYWIGASGQMGYYCEEHFMTQERYYGDGEYPGIQDHKNWKVSFREDGTACLVNTWEDFCDDGALQLAKYGEDKMTIVGLPEWLWTDSDIMLNRTALLPAYLYASEPVYDEPTHTCEWGPWEDDDVTDTHTRHCTVEGCTKKQTKVHNWDDGVQINPTTCTESGSILYTCPDCGASRTEVVDALGHNWSEWQDTGNGEVHVKICQNQNCDAQKAELHNWVPGDGERVHICSECDAVQVHDWVSEVIQAPTCTAEGQGNRVCTVCQTAQEFTMPIDPEAHNWEAWQVVKQPDEGVPGEETRVCTYAPQEHVQTRPIPALEHEHIYTDWEPYDDAEHRRFCMSDTCSSYEAEDHALAEEVVQAPDYGIPGLKRVYCQTCWYEQFTEIEAKVAETPAAGTTETVTVTAMFDNITIDPALLDIVASKVEMPAQAPANDYDKYVLNSMDGYLVDTVYDISLQDASGNKQELNDGETAKVTLYVGSENARKLEEQELLLVHVVGVSRKVYALGELTIDVEAGKVTFQTDSFSPFVLAVPPAELQITMDATAMSGGCDVQVSANASFLCNLYIAAYDVHGKMLAASAAGNCNLSAAPRYTLTFSGTASYVTAFMLETGASFTPRSDAKTDPDLNH